MLQLGYAERTERSDARARVDQVRRPGRGYTREPLGEGARIRLSRRRPGLPDRLADLST